MPNYFVNLWVTNDCNFRCTYCYAKGILSEQYLTTETASKLIDFIKTTKADDETLVINFHGGEPLLNIDIIKYIIELSRKNFQECSFGITTNGSLIDNTNIDWLARNFNFNLSISIDGKKDTHNLNRVSLDNLDNYDKIMRNAIELNKINRNVRIRMTVDKSTISDLTENVAYFFELGFLNIVPVLDYFNDWSDSELVLIKESFDSLKQFLNERNYSESIFEVFSISQMRLTSCDAGRNYFSVDYKGDIYPCIAVVGNEAFRIGSVNQGIDILKINLLESCIKYKPSDCLKCNNKLTCKGYRCSFINMATNNNYDKPNKILCYTKKLNEKYNSI